jgi:hypothetical protein
MKIVDRFREPSTWAGLAALIGLFGVNVPSETVHAVSDVGMALAGLAAVFLPERKS